MAGAGPAGHPPARPKRGRRRSAGRGPSSPPHPAAVPAAPAPPCPRCAACGAFQGSPGRPPAGGTKETEARQLSPPSISQRPLEPKAGEGNRKAGLEWGRGAKTGRRDPGDSRRLSGHWRPAGQAARAPRCSSRVPGSLQPLGVLDSFLDKKTETRNWGDCLGDNRKLKLGPGSPCVAAPFIPLTSHHFPGGRGSKPQRLMARLSHGPARRSPGGCMLPHSRLGARPLTSPARGQSRPSSGRGRCRRPMRGGPRGRHVSEGRKWRAAAVSACPRIPRRGVTVSLWGLLCASRSPRLTSRLGGGSRALVPAMASPSVRKASKSSPRCSLSLPS